MRLPRIDLFQAGTEVNAALLDEVRYAVDFLQDPPGGKFAQTSSQTISNNSWTAINFDTRVEDREYEVDSTTPLWVVGSPSLITIRTDGWYAFEMAPAFKGGSGGDVNTKRDVRLDIDGVKIGRKDFTSQGTTPVQYKGWYEYFLTAGAVVKMEMYQNRGSSLGTATPADLSETYGPTLRLKWVSL